MTSLWGFLFEVLAPISTLVRNTAPVIEKEEEADKFDCVSDNEVESAEID